ncbi:MAG: Fic family protein [Thermoplasmata archaeon]
MVSVKKKTIRGKEYYYLQHTVRTPTGVRTKEKYLGVRLPRDIDRVSREFLREIYKERWYPVLDSIRENYQRERRKTPESAVLKQTRLFSIRFTYDSNRIEGSSLTYHETADLLEKGITPREKSVADVKEAEAHAVVLSEVLKYRKDISLQAILFWHMKLFQHTKPDIAGKIRQHQVAISGSKFMPPSPVEVQPLLMEFFRWYEKNKSSLHPVELAALVHLKLVTVHPFSDGNGRIGRILMNFVLNRHGFPLLNIAYEKRRSYYSALERAQLRQDDSIFVQWLFKRYVKEHWVYAKAGK